MKNLFTFLFLIISLVVFGEPVNITFNNTFATNTTDFSPLTDVFNRIYEIIKIQKPFYQDWSFWINFALVVFTLTSVLWSINRGKKQAVENRKLLVQNEKQLEKVQKQIEQNEMTLKLTQKQIELLDKEYTNKFLVSLLVEFDITKLSFSEEKIEDRPKYFIFDDNHIILTNISNYPAYRVLFYSRFVHDIKPTYYDFSEEISYYGNYFSSSPLILKEQSKKECRLGFKIETKNQNIEKYFIDYQVSYMDLHGKKYTALFTYCVATIKTLNQIEPIISDFRFIIDGVDVGPGRRELIIPFDTAFENILQKFQKQ